MLLRNPRVQRALGGGWVERVGIRMVSLVEYLLLRGHKDREVLRTILTARWQRKTLVTFNEAYMVYSLARSVARLPGDFAEVGVYEGSTARLLCELKEDKALHLFDTFEGLPGGTTAVEKLLYRRKGQYACSLESVQAYLGAFRDVRYYKGLFPLSAAELEAGRRFALVHIDVDLYQSTLDCLQYFYPRLTPGGILLSHDYSVLEGVRQAFGEFLADKPERLVELPTTQCALIKI